MNISLTKKTLFIAHVLSLLILLGCAGQAVLTQELQDGLVERIERRWEFYSIGDYPSTWDFSTPEYRRIFPRESYYKNFHGYNHLHVCLSLDGDYPNTVGIKALAKTTNDDAWWDPRHQL